MHAGQERDPGRCSLVLGHQALMLGATWSCTSQPGHLYNDGRKTEPWRRLRGNKIVKMSVLTKTKQDQDKGHHVTIPR